MQGFFYYFDIQKCVVPLAGNANGEQAPCIPSLLLVSTCIAL